MTNTVDVERAVDRRPLEPIVLRSSRMTATLYCGDCTALQKEIDGHGIDVVLTDPPYGSTNAEWDTQVDWLHGVGLLGRVLVMTACGHFTFQMVRECPRRLRTRWIWIRGAKATGFFDVATRPMRIFEDVLVFGDDENMVYNPQMWTGERVKASAGNPRNAALYGKHALRNAYDSTERFPLDVVAFTVPDSRQRHHRTEKPVAMCEYFAETYTNAGETILDPFMGSGTTGVACVKTGRNFVGVELDEKFYGIAVERIRRAMSEPSLF